MIFPMPTHFAPAGPPPRPRPVRATGRVPSPGTMKRVAIVEDELMVAWALESTVDSLGCSVIGIFANADAVLAGMLGQPAELVLMDINLGGGMDGVETARRIRAAYGTPIIFISAYADQAMKNRIAASVPGALLLKKPLQKAELEMALGAVFGS